VCRHAATLRQSSASHSTARFHMRATTCLLRSYASCAKHGPYVTLFT
jgi:hypothetical protein